MDTKDYIGIALSVGGILSLLIAFWEKIFNSGKKDQNIVGRIEALEKTATKTGDDIEKIKTNHLAHMQTDINNINLNLVEINTTLKIRFEKEE